jgi:hypothetical protein
MMVWHLTTLWYGPFRLIDTTVVVALAQNGQLKQPLTVNFWQTMMTPLNQRLRSFLVELRAKICPQ